jgi:hypothetical protein
MELTGTVHAIMDEQVISDKFAKREFVLSYAENPEYPQLVKFEFTQDKTSALDSVNEGDEVTVHFNIRGREWTNPKGVTQYFNTLQAWKLDVTGGSTGVPEEEGAEPEDDGSELPF